MTFSEVLTAFIEKCRSRGREPATIRSYDFFVRNFLVPHLGDRDVTTLTFTDLEGLYTAMIGADYSPSTVRKAHATVSGALKLAQRNGWITTNPAPMCELPKDVKPELVVPTPAEVSHFLTIAAKRDVLIHDYARVGAGTGARPGEICGLMTADLDRTDNLLTIERAVDVSDFTPRIKGTKTGKIRRIVVDEQTADTISSRPPEWFLGKDAPARTDLLGKRFKPVAIAADLPWLTPRLFRHFHFTQLIESGRMSLPQMTERGGWSNSQMLLSRYGKWFRTSDTTAAEVIGALLS